MNGVEIRDVHPRGFLAFDLKDILSCLSDEAVQRVWTRSSVESTGEVAKELEDLSDGDGSIAGSDLMVLAGRIAQVIWGDFYGSLPGDNSPSLIVKAIDSTLRGIW
jgi:hypothetical protein